MKLKRILIIDDEVGFTKLLKLTLERTHLYQVQVENNSTQALEAARAFLPELILLDVIMPDADGGDVAARFKSDPVMKKVPIIFLTAMISPSEKKPGELISGYPYLAKPVSIPDLIRTIERNLIKKPAPSSLGSG
ncbi:MAG: response regulator [Chthoniobacterales bacterium]